MPAIYTRTGDKGATGLFGGSRVAKQSLRVEAYGTVDEGNAALGEAKAGLPQGQWRERVHHIQQRLFVLGAELASDEAGAAVLAGKICAGDITELEGLIDDCLAITGPQRAFVVPGRDQVSAPFHVVRTVIRRAERRTLTLADHEPVRPELITYLNRLSDAVYALARLAETWHEAARIESVVREVVARYADRLGLAEQGPGEEATTGRWAAMGRPSAPEPGRVTLDLAKRLATAAERRAHEIGVPMVIAVVDEAGDQVLLHRMPGSLPISLELAPNKAWTANAIRQPTSALGALARDGGELPGLGHVGQGRVVLFGGGAPLRVAEHTIGAIGISGGTVEQDCDVVNTAIESVMGVGK